MAKISASTISTALTVAKRSLNSGSNSIVSKVIPEKLCISDAIRYFKRNPEQLSWAGPTSSTGISMGNRFRTCSVHFERDKDFPDTIRKVVTKKDGSKAVGCFRNGELVSSVYTTPNGSKVYRNITEECRKLPPMFRGERQVTINLNDGTWFSRTTGQECGFIDTFRPQNGIIKSGGRLDSLYNEYMKKFLG